MSCAVLVRRLRGAVVRMLLLVIVVDVFSAERCTAAATDAASKLRRAVTQLPVAVYQGT